MTTFSSLHSLKPKTARQLAEEAFKPLWKPSSALKEQLGIPLSGRPNFEAEGAHNALHAPISSSARHCPMVSQVLYKRVVADVNVVAIHPLQSDSLPTRRATITLAYKKTV